MSFWPLVGAQRYATLGADAATSAGALITAGDPANTKGSWVELSSSLPFDVGVVQVILKPAGAVEFQGFLVDIGVGAAGSEVVAIPDLLVQSRNFIAFSYDFPISIPAGSRVAARCQSSTAAYQLQLVAVVAGLPWGLATPLNRVLAMGVNTGDTGSLVTVDPGATLHTKGAWVEVAASTAAPFKGLLAMATGAGNTAMTSANFLVDIGIGAAGFETVLIPDLFMAASTTTDVIHPGVWPVLPVDIPSGTRIAARAQASNIDATDRLFELALYGVA